MAVLTCDRMDYRDAVSRIVVDEKKKTVEIYLNGWMRYLFQVDEMEIKSRKGGKNNGMDIHQTALPVRDGPDGHRGRAGRPARRVHDREE
jgi:hypothetical protein